MSEIKKAAVIGAGVMGAGIAAQIANAGVPVVLLDIVPDGASNRNVIAEGAIQKLLKADPAPLMHKRNAKLITPGNIEDHLDLLADCDWIVEAVIEKLDVKQALYQKIEGKRKAGAAVSSNTSTIPLDVLMQGLPESFQRDFMITHFFNPPRYMRLLEIVKGKKTRDEAIAAVSRFADYSLGKSVVMCKDRPGFIANRLGVFWLQAGVAEAMDLDVSVEEADALIGRPLGIPKTGVFALLDLVGLDIMPHVIGSMVGALPKDDWFHRIYKPAPVIEKMIAEGYTGRKGKGGFYRINKANGEKIKESVSLKTGAYAPSRKASLASISAGRKDARKLLSHEDKGGRFAWRVMGQTLAYAAALVGDAADDIPSIDESMRLGYAWKFGPFELIDRLGVDWFIEKLEAEGWPVPEMLQKAKGRSFYRIQDGKRQVLGMDGAYHDVIRPEGVLLLEDIKLRSQPIIKNGSAALWDIGDGVTCLEFTGKMNSLDDQVMEMIRKSIREVKKNYKALVIYNEGSNFSVGANLGLALFAANIAAWAEIENLVEQGQQTYRALKYAPFPVVGAPSGLALGGGCEVLLHCDTVQAHAETYVGLVETGVGLVPGWGGCAEMLARWQSNPKLPRGPMPPVAKVFETVSVATVAKSAAEAKDYMFLRPDDGITMNRYRLLHDAKQRALALVEGYQPPAEAVYRLPGESGRVGLAMAVESFRKLGKATPHDTVVAGRLAEVLTGGSRTDHTIEISEEKLLEFEREAFMKLVRDPNTLARVEHMLETGKPLRN